MENKGFTDSWHRASGLDSQGPARSISPMPLQHTTREEVMFFDTDIGGVVHNLAYLRMIETCRTKLAGLLGMDLKGMAETKRFPVVVRTEIDYRRPATLGDALLIHGTFGGFQRARFWCEFEVRRESDNVLLITARQCLALVQMPEGRPLRLPVEWLER